MQYVNLTPHAIHLNDGRVFPPSGIVARVNAEFIQDRVDPDTYIQKFAQIEGLPAAAANSPVRYIVSAIVLAATGGRRFDVVAPATGHPDVKRNDKGQIVSVPGFVRG